MAFIADAALDAALTYIADNGERLDLCSAEPTTYTEATSTFTLGNVSLTAGTAGSDWSLVAGDTSGRKLTLAAQTVTDTAAGTATHYAITDVAATTLIATNTMQNVAMDGSGTQDVNAVDVLELQDPTSE